MKLVEASQIPCERCDWAVPSRSSLWLRAEAVQCLTGLAFWRSRDTRVKVHLGAAFARKLEAANAMSLNSGMGNGN